MHRWLTAIMVLVTAAITAAVGARAQMPAAEAPTMEPPRIGQPPDFSQVAGTFRIAAQVQPASVAVEEPVMLTVTIRGQAAAPYVPKRDLLRIFPDDMQRDFYVEPAGEQAKQGSWEFTYRLRPKHTRVQFVPSLKLVYFAPRQRRYQSAYSDALPLTVQPRPDPEVKIAGLTVVQAPPTFLELAEEDGRRDGLRDGLGDGLDVRWSPYQEIVLLAAAPLLCVTGVWWLHHRQSRRAARHWRRRRAVEHVVASLKASRDAAGAARLVADYLRLRLDIPAAEPTPAELERWLKRRGISKPTRQQWRSFLQRCDAARFAPAAAPAPAVGASAGDEVATLIHALEEEPCLAAR
ncbi:MAG: hypothetical protein L0Y71_04080 [Gemmataceae bacterium]|nr:hypothetical protein [Gemmataceae bacterium]